LQQYFAGEDVTKSAVQTFLVDPTIPCEKSFEETGFGDVRQMTAHGVAGIAGMIPEDGLYGLIDEEGRLQISINGKSSILAIEIPLEMRKDLDLLGSAMVVIRNKEILVLSLTTRSGGWIRLLFRQKDQQWRHLPVIGKATAIRGFGRFVAFVEGYLKAGIQESAGRSFWRKERTATGPAQEEWFVDDDIVNPGRLHLYDSDSGRVYTIVTNQGDSEIVLVENNTVYYRVGDKLYSAPINAKDIGAALLLATGDEIRDAHWAFTTRK
jgi:hypothetical protein